ncbi:S1 family peptidase, partial [Streptomyces sp. NPDC005728]|uniref:S1 family peptidase n=1 Tax=Streptomyces sp. NPDC005728 TaxID=3157054 RepID=UPI0033E511D4
MEVALGARRANSSEHRRVSRRTGVILGIAVASTTVAALVVLPHANASQTGTDGGHGSFVAASQLGERLTAALGSDSAGWYYDAQDKNLVVNVLSDRAAQTVRSTGAQASVVRNSVAQLQDTLASLRARASVPGTAFSIDLKANKVSVLADPRVTGRIWDKLTRVTDTMPATVTVARAPARFKPLDVGVGDAIFGGGARCSLGFNVTLGGQPGFLTAGHCARESQEWSDDNPAKPPIGKVVQSQFPGQDFALVQYNDTATVPPTTVALADNTLQQIDTVTQARIGMPVQRSGSTTGIRAGFVTGLNATVNFGNGDIVSGLIRTNVCAESGDSGGGLFFRDAAVGLTSGGAGDCTRGGVTFFQPVNAALQATGAQLATAGFGGGQQQGGGDQSGFGGGQQQGGGDQSGFGGGQQQGGSDQSGFGGGQQQGGSDQSGFGGGQQQGGSDQS